MKSKFKIAIKSMSEEGTFEGILSPYGNVDQGGDVVEPGAFTKTIKERGASVPLLWQHRVDSPIGKLQLIDTDSGLMVKGALLMDLEEAKKAYLCIKSGIVRGLSIGFETIKETVKSGVRHLLEIKLYEGSIVTFPMNESALITAVKQRMAEEKSGDDFASELAEIQLADAGYQMRNALAYVLTDIVWSGLSKEDMLALAETSIQQFSDAYMAFLPAYIDLMAERYGMSMEAWNQAVAERKQRDEAKAGATISQANKSKIESCVSGLDDIKETLNALIAEKAGSSTFSEKAADNYEGISKTIEAMRQFLIPSAH